LPYSPQYESGIGLFIQETLTEMLVDGVETNEVRNLIISVTTNPQFMNRTEEECYVSGYEIFSLLFCCVRNKNDKTRPKVVTNS
jgi:hypothetical protein